MAKAKAARQPTRQMIFVNLPVSDLDRSKEFFGELGFKVNPMITNDDAAGMMLSDDIYLMLLKPDFFKTFTPKEVVDAKRGTEVLVALSAESREKVDELVDRALSAGATTPRPETDLGYMYGRAFEDPDGHIWEVTWMDMEAARRAAEAAGGSLQRPDKAKRE